MVLPLAKSIFKGGLSGYKHINKFRKIPGEGKRGRYLEILCSFRVVNPAFMKALFLLLFLFPMQQSRIADIRYQVYYINTHLKVFKQKQVSHPEGQSTEGGMSVAYYAKDTLRLITDNTYWENGKEITQYYFHEGELIFAYIIRLAYNRPIYDKDFDYNKSKKTEQRYYFYHKKIIKGGDKGSPYLLAAHDLASSLPRP